MIIIVEGSKYSGKTTLCNALHNIFGGEIIHFPTSPDITNMLSRKLTEDEYIQVQDMMEADIDRNLAGLDPDKTYILDRSFISNAVYRPGEHIIIKDKYKKILDSCILIILLTDKNTINQRIQERTNKTMTEIEESKLDYSIDRFKKISDSLGCQELDAIIPGLWKVTYQPNSCK